MQNLGIIGLAGSGKTTVGKMIVSSGGYHRSALADPMKASLGFLAHVQLDLPMPLHMSVTDAFASVRRIMAGGMGRPYMAAAPIASAHRRDIAVRDHFFDYVNANKPAFRGALQQWGTEVIRGLAAPDEPWVAILLREATTTRTLFGVATVCDDVRYSHEVAQMRAAGFRFVRVVRPDADGLAGDAANHSSEQFWSTLTADDEIVNDGTLDQLAAKVGAYLSRSQPLAA